MVDKPYIDRNGQPVEGCLLIPLDGYRIGGIAYDLPFDRHIPVLSHQVQAGLAGELIPQGVCKSLAKGWLY